MIGKPPWKRLGVRYEQWYWDTIAMHYVPGPLCLCTLDDPALGIGVCHLAVGHKCEHRSLAGNWSDEARLDLFHAKWITVKV